MKIKPGLNPSLSRYDQKRKTASYNLKLTIRVTMIIFLASILLAACFLEKDDQKNSQFERGNPSKQKRTILEIEGQRFRNSDYAKYLRLTVGEDFQFLPAVSLSRLYDDFVEEKILLISASQKGLSLSDKEKEDYLSRLEEEVYSDEQGSFDKEDIEFFFDRLLIDKYSLSLIEEIQVSAEEIRDYYEQNEKEFLKPERVKVSQILLDSEEKAMEILDQIKDESEQEFRKTARESSLGVEAQKGGEMGIFEKGQLPFEMEEVIFSLNAGELSDVIQSAYGFHIFRLDKQYGAEHVSIQDAGPDVKMKIKELKIKKIISEHIEDQKKALDWKRQIQNLTFTYERDRNEK